MATRGSSSNTYHTCTCGEAFESTEELLAHARAEHGLGTY